MGEGVRTGKTRIQCSITLLWDTLQWTWGGGAPGASTLLPKIFSISCSFWEILANLYVGAPWAVGTPSYRESWIRPCPHANDQLDYVHRRHFRELSTLA